MSKGKKVKSNNNFRSTNTNVKSDSKIEIDYDKLAMAIVKAHQISAENDKTNSLKQEQKSKQEWNDIIGYKEYPENENCFLKRVHSIKNDLTIFVKTIFFKKENAKADYITFSLLKMVLSGLIGIIKWIFYVFAVILLLSTFFKIENKCIFLTLKIEYLSFAFGFFIIACILRIAVFEVENMKDRTLLMSILSVLISIVAAILALVALFK